MKDATVGALARRSGAALPAVPMATPVDPILTAIARDRIAYVAFAASLNKTDGRKAAQEKGREVTRTDEDAYGATRVQRMRLANLGDGFPQGGAPSFRPRRLRRSDVHRRNGHRSSTGHVHILARTCNLGSRSLSRPSPQPSRE